MLTLVTGGARSGKSSFAENIARYYGGRQVLYFATARNKDSEMAVRIRQHRLNRPDGWQTIEEPYKVTSRLKEIEEGSVILLDCITVLISNLLLKGQEADEGEFDFEVTGTEKDVISEIEGIVSISQKKDFKLIAVSNEVGTGIVPVYSLGRLYRDIAGRANQYLASAADEVYLCIAGLPVEIKEIGMKNIERFKQQGNG